MGKRIKIGDIIELKTTKGLAYAIFTHVVPRLGSLIYIFDKHYGSRPSNLGEIVAQEVQFGALFPLQYAVKQKIVEVIGNLNVPVNMKKLPMFRGAGKRDANGKVLDWYLWDNGKEKDCGRSLTESEKRMPLLQVLNDTALFERVESGWRSEQEI